MSSDYHEAMRQAQMQAQLAQMSAMQNVHNPYASAVNGLVGLGQAQGYSAAQLGLAQPPWANASQEDAANPVLLLL